MKKRIITLAIGAGTMAVAGLGVMSPAAHACGVGNQSGAGNVTPAASPVYAGGSPSAGYAGVQGLSPAATGYIQVSGGTASGSGTAEANGSTAASASLSSSVTVDGSGVTPCGLSAP